MFHRFDFLFLQLLKYQDKKVKKILNSIQNWNNSPHFCIYANLQMFWQSNLAAILLTQIPCFPGVSGPFQAD
jgi:hypothetical protein